MNLDLTAILFTKEVAIIAAAIFALVFFLGKLPAGKRQLGQTRVWSKLVPVLPLALGIGAAFLPGVIPLAEGQTLGSAWGNLVLIGVWAGLVASQGRKIFKRLLVDKSAKGTPS